MSISEKWQRHEREKAMYTFDRERYNKRMEWYLDARFGMFIHWGLYAIPARGEWVRSVEEMPKEDYMQYFEEFDPVDYDPRAWEIGRAHV